VLGLGAPIRRTAGATALLITVLILLPAFAGALPPGAATSTPGRRQLPAR